MKNKINSLEWDSKARKLRKQFGEDDNSPIDIFAFVNNIPDITLIKIELSEDISGMCIKDGNNKIIAINSNLSYGRQRFTLAHELCHLYFHGEEAFYVCNLKDGIKNMREKEADMFASHFLAPWNAFMDYIDSLDCGTDLGLEDIIKIEQYFGMSHIAVLIRLKEEGFLYDSEIEDYKLYSPIQESRKLGFSTRIYKPSKDNKNFTTGKYIRLANKLLDDNKISNGRYEEFLLEAFREDIVYNLGGGEEQID